MGVEKLTGGGLASEVPSPNPRMPGHQGSRELPGARTRRHFSL